MNSKNAGPERATPHEAIVAANVRRFRDTLGISQTELAHRAALGSSDMAICGIENGKRRIKVADLCALADAFGIAPAHLLTPDAELAGPVRQYKVRIDGGITETVAADDIEADEWGLLHFFLRGERVFFTSVARVLCVQEAH
ncbi:helix-turn-helix domain-containing protein [Streptomyces sp. NBC_01613]|uniref:helix-turn-helix domain-containing protein n=1 Tax=Streptomyces sp. NBC_01613 TaxID=2975896 RepID=UPI00386F53A6